MLGRSGCFLIALAPSASQPGWGVVGVPASFDELLLGGGRLARPVEHYGRIRNPRAREYIARIAAAEAEFDSSTRDDSTRDEPAVA